MNKICKICKIGGTTEGESLCFDCNNNIQFIMVTVFMFLSLCLLLIYLGGFRIFFDIILLLIGIVIICFVVIITLYTLAYILLYIWYFLKRIIGGKK